MKFFYLLPKETDWVGRDLADNHESQSSLHFAGFIMEGTSKVDGQLSWIYEGTKAIVNREDYLLGKRVCLF